MLVQAGDTFRRCDRSDNHTYRVEAVGLQLYSAEMGNEPESVIILRPVLSGHELMEAHDAQLATWFVVTEDILEDVFEAL